MTTAIAAEEKYFSAGAELAHRLKRRGARLTTPTLREQFSEGDSLERPKLLRIAAVIGRRAAS